MTEEHGTVSSLQIAVAHRAPMQTVESAQLRADWGIEGDLHAHAGGMRQVLLMDEETLAALDLRTGIVKENITTRGIELKRLTPGTHVRVGSALLEITQSCAPCRQMDEIRPGLREVLEGQRGMLARVIEGGAVRQGDAIQVVA